MLAEMVAAVEAASADDLESVIEEQVERMEQQDVAHGGKGATPAQRVLMTDYLRLQHRPKKDTFLEGRFVTGAELRKQQGRKRAIRKWRRAQRDAMYLNPLRAATRVLRKRTRRPPPETLVEVDVSV